MIFCVALSLHAQAIAEWPPATEGEAVATEWHATAQGGRLLLTPAPRNEQDPRGGRGPGPPAAMHLGGSRVTVLEGGLRGKSK